MVFNDVFVRIIFLMFTLVFILFSSVQGANAGNGGNNGNVSFDAYFENKTMRLDYFHSGNAAEEHFAVDRILSDGKWWGSRTILRDALNLGPFRFEIIDKESGIRLYSRGFAGIFEEWQTIPDAKTQWGTFHESIRFPWPKKTVKVVLQKRDKQKKFKDIWNTEIDPASRAVTPVDIIHTNTVFTVMENGPSEKKVDLVMLGDGYKAEEMEK
ncbi:MAG: hypothetical protein GY950_01130, partial [bacterium]|nr:hypothetical protein [bacterium]